MREEVSAAVGKALAAERTKLTREHELERLALVWALRDLADRHAGDAARAFREAAIVVFEGDELDVDRMEDLDAARPDLEAWIAQARRELGGRP